MPDSNLIPPATVRRLQWLVALLACLLGTPLWGQAQKPPGVGYVFPPVIRAGETAEVILGGFDWTDDLDWFVHRGDVHLEPLSPPGDYLITPPPYWTGPRASIPALPIAREVTARIRADAGAAPGLVRWQVANANGASQTAVFLVSRDNEIVESRSRDLPQRLPELPVAVSGRLSRLTEEDRYEFSVPQDGLVTLDLMARRLGARFHGQLEVLDHSGRIVADFADTQGLDGAVTFAAKGGELYTARLHDVDFRGDRSFVYRLALRVGPRVVTTLPARGRRGETLEVEFVGYGLATGSAALESVRQTVQFPSEPTAAVHRHRLSTPAGPAEVEIPVGDLPEIAAPLPAAPLDRALPIVPPQGMTVRAPAGEEDLRFDWESTEKQAWTVVIQAQEIGSPLDFSLRVLGPDGTLVAESDDQPGTLDPHLHFAAPKGGRYTAVLHCLTPRSGRLDETFRIEVRPQSPGFTLGVPQTVAVPLAGKAGLKVTVGRTGGFTGPVAITAEGLPRGTQPAGDWTIPEGKGEATLSLEAAADADVTAARIRITGTADVGGKALAQEAAVRGDGPLCFVAGDPSMALPLLLTVTMEPPFEIKVVDRERQREVHRGTTYPAELEIHRREGFTGAMQIAMSAQQDRDRQGVRGLLLSVPAPSSRGPQPILYPCTMPEWLSTELTRRIVVHGVAGVPDPKGRIRFLTRAGDARITMIMEGALLKLTAGSEPAVLSPGGSTELPFSVSRSVKLPLVTKVELVIPPELAGLIEAAPVMIEPGQEAGRITLRTQSDPRLNGVWTLELRATAMQEDRWPVVSSATLRLAFE